MSPLHVPLLVELSNDDVVRHVTREMMSGLRFSSGVPGGFKTADINVFRSLRMSWEDIQPYSDMKISDGRTGEIVWQGKLEDPGRAVSSAGEMWAIGGTGPSARARDRKFPLIYVDRSLDRWFPEAGPTRAFDFGKAGQDGPVLTLGLGAGENISDTSSAFWIYTALSESSQLLAYVSADWDSGATDTDYAVRLTTELATVETNAFNTAGGNLDGIKSVDWAATNPRDAYLGVVANGVNPPAVPDSVHRVEFGPIVVRAILLDVEGNAITTGYSSMNEYVTVEEVVRDLLGRFFLGIYDGTNASIVASTQSIEQFAFPDGVTPEEVFAELMKYDAQKFWAAWEDKETPGESFFEWKQWPSSVRFEASTEDGFDSPGSSVDLYNAVNVRWLSPVGKIRRTQSTQTVPELDDAGLTRTAFIDASDEIAWSAAGAQRIGGQFLAEHATPPNAGTLTIKRKIIDIDYGMWRDPWELVRHGPGNLIRVRDLVPRVDALNATSRDAVTVFKIVEAEYDASENAVRLQLDSISRTITNARRRTERAKKR